MSRILRAGTLCIVTHTPTGADMGRIVEVVAFLGATRLGPSHLPEAYRVRCVAGRPFHSIREWLPDGRYVVWKDTAYSAIADRSQLRPLPGVEDEADATAHAPAPEEEVR